MKDLTKGNIYKTFILFAVAPFNLLKGIIISALSFVIYRKLGRQLEG